MPSHSKPVAKPPAKAATGRAAPRTPPHEVRIIGGQWKRSKLSVPNHDGLRPTPNRVRETLFNWLGQNLTGWRCIDAFAGSGALGLEAASRGAAEVLLVEQDAALVHNLRATSARLKATGVAVEREDALQALRRRAGKGFHLVFLDPPFLEGQNDALVRSALAASLACLAPQGVVYLESPRAWAPEELAELGLAQHRAGKAGAVHFALLQAAG